MAQQFTVDTLEFREESGSLLYWPTKTKRVIQSATGSLLGIVAVAAGLLLLLGRPLAGLTSEMELDLPFGLISLLTGLALFVGVVFFLMDAKRGVQIKANGEIVHGRRLMRVSSPDELTVVFHHSARGYKEWSVSHKTGKRFVQLPWLRFNQEFEAERVYTEIAEFLR